MRATLCERLELAFDATQLRQSRCEARTKESDIVNQGVNKGERMRGLAMMLEPRYANPT